MFSQLQETMGQRSENFSAEHNLHILPHEPNQSHSNQGEIPFEKRFQATFWFSQGQRVKWKQVSFTASANISPSWIKAVSQLKLQDSKQTLQIIVRCLRPAISRKGRVAFCNCTLIIWLGIIAANLPESMCSPL